MRRFLATIGEPGEHLDILGHGWEMERIQREQPLPDFEYVAE